MRRYYLIAIATVAMTVAIGAEGRQAVLAGGYWNMPGTLPQRVGYGYSGGYHAPFILGPMKFDGLRAPNEIRLRCAPCCCCTYACDCGCERSMDAPSTIAGIVATTPPTQEVQPVEAPVTIAPAADNSSDATPSSDAARPLFDPPVQP